MNESIVPQSEDGEYTDQLITIINQEALRATNGASDHTRNNIRAVVLMASRKLERAVGDEQRQRAILHIALATVATQRMK